MAMSCPSRERIAAAASGEDEHAALHAESCESCGDALAKQRDTAAMLRRLPAPPLVGEQRRTIEALVRARADEPMETQRRWPVAVGIVAIAAAATVAIVAALPKPTTSTTTVATPEPTVPVAHESAPLSVAHESAPPPVARAPSPAPSQPPRPPAVVDMSLADAVRSSVAVVPVPVDAVRPSPSTPDEVVTLRGGTLTIDARDRRAPIDVVAGPAKLHVADAKVRITARAGTVATVQVFAGSVEMTVGSHHTVIEDVWVAPATMPPATTVPATTARTSEPAPSHEPTKVLTAVERALGEFRTGWTELHAGHYDDAIASFDRATDPVVAEDATYWAAIAAERAGKQDDAVVRLRAFVKAFPNSPRVDDAHRVLTKLGH